MDRRLAAILAADMVGYSRSLEPDEAGVLACLRISLRSCIDPEVVADDDFDRRSETRVEISIEN